MTKKEKILEVYKKTNGKCWYCGDSIDIEKRANRGNRKGSFVIDHINPRHFGGIDDVDNLVPSCCTCNTRKGVKTIEEFRVLMTRIQNGVPLFSEKQIMYLNKVGKELPSYNPYIFYFEK